MGRRASALTRALAVRIGAATLIAAASASPAIAGGARLYPDLVTMRIAREDLFMEQGAKKTLLRLSNEIGNRGRGPLEIYPSAGSNNCDGDNDPSNDRDAYQRIFLDGDGNGVFSRDADPASSSRRFGCKRFHPAHQHWHLLDFARYRLRRERTGKTVARSTKVGFCIVDEARRFPALPGSPQNGYYTPDCSASSTDGISIGWADEYAYTRPGQQLNVTGLTPARYCLVSTADPHDRLRESNDSNNTREARIWLNPDKPRVHLAPGSCRS